MASSLIAAMRGRGRWRPVAATLALLIAGRPGQLVAQTKDVEAPIVHASASACPVRPFRWDEDCRNLRGTALRGLDALRYVPLDRDGQVWLTFGGDARTRLDILQKVDFGLGGAPGFVEISGRLLAHADLRHASGLRAFVQLGVVQQSGRKPRARAQDESSPDVTQLFVDLPASVGAAKLLLRVGRQELSLSGNRLVTARDGSTIRRAFQGAKLEAALKGWKLALVGVRPMDLRDALFADRADRTERFSAASLDLPGSSGARLTNLFLLVRKRQDGRYLRAVGAERRTTLGAHVARQSGPWLVDLQAAIQRGRAVGNPVRAFGGATSLDYEIDKKSQWTVGFDAAIASGDKAGTAAIETFDPTYPNNMGLSDAPLFYQTNYIYAGGSTSIRWAGVTWATATNLLARQSTGDAVYANGAPIAAAFGPRRLTSLLSQVSARAPIGRSFEIYATAVRAGAIGSLAAAGAHDAFYSRVQLTARF